MMKKILYSVLAALVLLPSLAAASVVYESDPLFTAGNLLPGDTVDGNIYLTNDTGTDKEIRLTIENETETKNFLSALELIITNGSTELYHDTLANARSASYLPLGVLSAGDSATFTAEVHFLTASGNSYQGATAGFDICTGFAGNALTCIGATEPTTPTTTSGGGGRSNPNTYWRDADGDGYGDPASSIQALSRPPGYVTNNLDCDDTNPLQNTDPLCGGEIAGEETVRPLGGGDSGGTVFGASTQGINDQSRPEETETPADEPTPSVGSPLLTRKAEQAASVGFIGLSGCTWLYLLIMLVVLLSTILWDAQREHRYLSVRAIWQGRGGFMGVATLAATLIAIILRWWCDVVPLLITALLFIGTTLIHRLLTRERDWLDAEDSDAN